MLILNVKAQWSSTHQMVCKFLTSIVFCYHLLLIYNIGHALQFQKEIDDFVGCNCDLQSLDLDKDKWDKLKLLTSLWHLRQQQPRCQHQRSLCFPQCTQSLGFFRSIFNKYIALLEIC